MKGMMILVSFFSAACMILAGGASGDSIYRWVDKEGVVHFTDVAPPPDAETYYTPAVQVKAQIEETPQDQASPEKAAAEEAPAKEAPTQNADDESSAPEEDQNPPKETSKETLKKFLVERVEKRKKSIEEIEKLLKERPNDLSLQKSLQTKQQHLQEELNALKAFKE